MKFEEYRYLYQIYRDYVIHQTSLINNRLTWILTIHGFLYATYGITLQKEIDLTRQSYEVLSKNSDVGAICSSFIEVHFFLFMISCVGLSISYYGLKSIRAAINASHGIEALYSNKYKHIENESINGMIMLYYDVDGVTIPYIRGAGLGGNIHHGNAASVAIPYVLGLSWCASIIVIALTVIRNWFTFSCPV